MSRICAKCGSPMVSRGSGVRRTLAIVGLLAVGLLAIAGTIVVPLMIPLWMVLLVSAVGGFLLLSYRTWSCPKCQ